MRTMKAKANLFRPLVVLAAVLVGVAVALFGVGLRSAESQTTAPSYYKVVDLGTIPRATYSPPTSESAGINDFGHVVGYAALSSFTYYEGGYPSEYVIGHPFLYKDGVMTDLGLLAWGSGAATAINNSGQVVGNSVDGNWSSHAFLYKDDGDPNTADMKELGTLGGTDSQAYGINDSGQVVGLSSIADNQNYHAFLYKDGVMKDLGLLGGTYRSYYSNSQANGINNSGQVVGWSADDIGHQHAFLYKDGVMKDLGTLGGSNSWAYGINTSGQVVGYSDTSSGEYHAFLYDGSATLKLQDLGTLGGNSTAWDINDSSQVVGYSYTSAGAKHAFLKESGQPMIDLNSLIPADSGWTIRDARAINNDGQIAATGDKEGVGQHALLLTPTSSDTPPPADDTEAPAPPTITSPQNNSYDTDGSFSVSGSAEASSTVELFEGTTSRGTIKADSTSGAWSIDLSGVSEGAHTYTAKATDAAGNTSSASDSITVTVDKTAPKVDSVLPKEDATTGVAPGVNVTAIFSEGMRDASVKSAFKLYKKGTTTALGATVSYDTTNKMATLDPSANLKRGTTYKAVVSTEAQDLAGNPLAQQKVWFFTVS